MSKRRVTLSLDADVAEALGQTGAATMSAAANDILRKGIEAAAHRAAALCWLSQLDSEHGTPSREDAHRIDALIAELDAESAPPEKGAA